MSKNAQITKRMSHINKTVYKTIVILTDLSP